MIVTQEIAKNILSKRQVVHTPGVYNTKHRVSTGIYAWEETGEAYKIVNTDLMSGYTANEARNLFIAGDYAAATNKGMSFRANLELAEKLEGSMLSQVMIEEVELKSGEKALMIRKMVAKEATKTSAFSFDNLEAKSPVLDSKIQAPEAVSVF
jgi:hypothetical protein